MAVKPTEKPFWAINDVNDPVTGEPNKDQPTAEFQNEGLNRLEPLFRNHLNWQFNNIGQWIDYLESTISTIDVDTTIYVSTTGDDGTGDGTLLNPYATPQRALNSLIGVPIATDVLVTISCAAGVYNLTSPIVINHPYGERIHIIGDTLLGVKPQGVPIADWSGDRNSPSVPARGTNEYYNTAGTLGVSADTATRQAAISSDLTNNLSLIQSRYATVFSFTDSSGVVVDGNNSLGKLDKVALLGNWDGDFSTLDPSFNVYHGIDVAASLETTGFGTPRNVTGGTIFIGDEVVIAGFKGVGIRCRYGGCVTAEDNIAIVNNRWSGIDLNGFGGCVANYCLIAGNGYHGVFATNTNTMKAGGSISTGNLLNGIQISNGSSARIREFKSLGNGFSGIAAQINGSLSMDNSQYRGNAFDGISMTIGSASDGDTVISSDNGRDGLFIDAATYDGSSLVIENNGRYGVYSQNQATSIISSSQVGNNSSVELYADRASFIRGSSVTLPSGSSVLATKNSYISIGNLVGVAYNPTYGTVGSDGATINE